MIAAGTAAENGAQVILLEKNGRLGRKLSITGKGRCNLTNECDPDTFFENIPRNPRFLQSAVRRFAPRDAMAFFESLGVPLKTERGRRIFPQSDRASDVTGALEAYVRRAGVQVKTGASVAALLTEDGAVSGVRLKDGETVSAGRVIVATGGLSYPLTGSTGDGYRFAEEAGHRIVPPRASLVPVETVEDWCAEAQGLSLRNVTLTAVDAQSGKRVFFEQGELLFTHYGVSGPLVLSASVHLEEPIGRYRFFIDLKPALDEQILDARLLRDFSASINRNFENALDRLLPRKLIPVAVRLSGIASETKVNQITKEERRRFCGLLKALPLTPRRLRPVAEAVVTAGGVAVTDVDPRTMASRLVRGLFFAGEVLDVDGYTGGFNLQIAWSTGRAAGIAAAKKEDLR